MTTRRALVTGGAKGIGRAIADRLAGQGAIVSVIGRDHAALAACGHRFAAADVTDGPSFAAAIAELGPFDILVNNAGAAFSAPFARHRNVDWNAMLAVNLTAAFIACQSVLPAMVAQGFGRIVSVASTAGLKGYAYTAAYCAAKHGLIGLTRALAVETARTGVTVNAVCPGFTDTALVDRAANLIATKTGKSADDARAALARTNPQNRLVTPAEVADAVAFLCGEDAGSMTGQGPGRGRRGDNVMNNEKKHFGWRAEGPVATITLNRPEKKNPLTFESYAELRDTFRELAATGEQVKAVVLTGAGGNFCSGGDVFEIIEPLTKMKMPELLAFTRMTGDLVRAMRACPQPIIAAVEGVCAGAGAILAMASDLRYATAASRTAFLFTRVGLAGCDMGACAILPRLIGQGRASELLLTGRAMTGEEGHAWGFFNALHAPGEVLAAAHAIAEKLASGPTFAHGITKTMLHREWSMDIDSAIEAEAQAQAICMATQDFTRAFEAFAAKRAPVFKGD